MLQSQLVLLAQKLKSGLHLLLMIGIVLYVYSPMLDHWFGSDTYTRPHTHIHLSANILVESPAPNSFEVEDDHSENSESQEFILCSLDINTLFCVTPDANVFLIVQKIPLIFDLFPYLVMGSSVFLASLDPPPRIYS